MAKQASQRRSTTNSPIPDKLYFRIGEVAKLCGVEAYVLRFWETEFPQLKPNKSGTGQRLYRKRDVELALRVKQLLHSEGYTIAGTIRKAQAEHPLVKRYTLRYVRSEDQYMSQAARIDAWRAIARN